MSEPLQIRPLSWSCSPAAALRAWPADTPVALVRLTPPAARTPRCTILAPLTRAATDIAPILARPLRPPAPLAPGWILALDYELGFTLEPAAQSADPSPAHAAFALRYESASVFDHRSSAWFWVGAGSPPALRERDLSFETGPLQDHEPRERYEAMVAQALQLIAAGDVYQVNLSRALRAPFQGSTRALFAALDDAVSPLRGAYIENPAAPDAAICSVSPELLFDLRAEDRAVFTSPIKGTRPARTHPRALLDSDKDRAELAMIVDLMRNDLGRVAAPASVRVVEPGALERHGGASLGVWHTTATVRATLRDAATPLDLLRAGFPAGSITGAPKIRAMQIIRDLERRARGFYCGALGLLTDAGALHLNVAIRTATVRDGALEFPVGAGIVADSAPDEEWRETNAKAAAVAAALSAARNLCAGAPA